MLAKHPARRTRIGKRNQVTIPADVLRALDLGPGAEVQIELKADGTAVLSKPADPFVELARLREEFKRNHPSIPVGPMTDEEFTALIGEARIQRSVRASEDDQRIMRESS
ncbi:MAG: AbrB/MazE/SpoVT family DNA-binding domain-containing protein [Anaerolineaceae bacterium]